MSKSRGITTFVLTLSFMTLAIAACDTQSDRHEGGGVATNPPTTTMSPMASPAVSPATSASVTLTPFDREFMLDAARDNVMEVQLGNLAAQKAASADVKRFGQRLAEDHSRVGQMLRQLATSLNITLPQELAPEQRNEVSRIQNLPAKDFDREFIKMMIADHTKDISEYERAASQSTDLGVKQYASQALPAMRDHLKMSRDIAGKLGVKPAAQSQ